MRAEFSEISSGWLIIDDFNDLTYRIEELAKVIRREPGPLEKDEHLLIEMMISRQIAMGIELGDFDFLFLVEGKGNDIL